MGFADSVKHYIPACCALTAAICGTAANVYCQTIEFQQVGGGGNTLYAGVWGYRTKDVYEGPNDTWVYTTCRSYNYLDRELGFDYDLDSKSRTVMAFSILAPVIGGIGLFFSCFFPCMTISAKFWQLLGISFVLAGICQGITLMVSNSAICTNNPALQFLESEFPNLRETFPDECEKSIGNPLNIVAVVFWIVAAIMVKCIPPPVADGNQPTQIQTATYDQKPDGTAEESNVVVQGAAVDAPETALEEKSNRK